MAQKTQKETEKIEKVENLCVPLSNSVPSVYKTEYTENTAGYRKNTKPLCPSVKFCAFCVPISNGHKNILIS